MPTFRVPASPDMINPSAYEDFARASSSQTHTIKSGSNNRAAHQARIPAKKRTCSADKVTFSRSLSDQCLYRPKKPRRKPTPPKQDYDYVGLTNQMRKISFGRSRKWTQTLLEEGEENDCKKPPENGSSKKENREDEESSQVSVDNHSRRRHRTSHFTKYRYPQNFHARPKGDVARFERNIPQCLRLTQSYCFMPVRQNCRYLPLGSVTHTKVHSITSGCLPHPENPDQITPRRAKRRRPMSAPPAIAKTSGTFSRGSSMIRPASSSWKGKAAIQPHPPPAATKSQNSAPLRGEPDDFNLEDMEDHDRNGSYHYVYNRKNSVQVPVDDLDDLSARAGHGDDRDDCILVEDFEPEDDSSLDDGYSDNKLGKRDIDFGGSPPPPRGPTRMGRRDSSPESIHTEEDEGDQRKQVVREILESNKRQQRRRRRSKKAASSVDSDGDSLVDAEQLRKDMSKKGQNSQNALQTLSSEEDIGYEPDFGDVDDDRESVLSRSVF